MKVVKTPTIISNNPVFTTLLIHISVYHTPSPGRTHVPLTDDGVWCTETCSTNTVNIYVMNKYCVFGLCNYRGV